MSGQLRRADRADGPGLRLPLEQLVVGRVADLLEHQRVRGHHGHRRIPDAGTRGLCAGHATGRRPSPTGSSAPTRDRTIEWQKASAWTVHHRHPVAVADASAAPAARAPRRRSSRCLQNAREVVLAEQRLGGLVHPSRSSGRGHGSDRVPVQRRRADAAVADPVGVSTPDGREPGIEPGRRRADRGDADVVGQRAVDPAHVDVRPASRRTSRWATWPRACTPASVRPAQVRSTSTPQKVAEHPLQLALDGAQAGGSCWRPAGEVPAVVRDVQAQTNQPVARGSGDGLIGVA